MRVFFFSLHLKTCLLISESGEGKETSIGCLLHVPQVGTEPASQACALTGSQTHDLSVYDTML